MKERVLKFLLYWLMFLKVDSTCVGQQNKDLCCSKNLFKLKNNLKKIFFY